MDIRGLSTPFDGSIRIKSKIENKDLKEVDEMEGKVRVYNFAKQQNKHF